MSEVWADKTAQQLLSRGFVKTGICLILGAADTGKTTLAAALAKCATSSEPVGIIDADIGQSHIGPPTTVGWAVVENSQIPFIEFSDLPIGGISFVGDVTPARHLLQLTAAITQCVQQVSKAAELMIIDTPGFIRGPAATALWWTVQRILQPKLILAVTRNDELNGICAGLRSLDLKLELIKSPQRIPTKSPPDRRNYRQNQFSKYFRDSCLYNISLSNMAVQTSWNLSREIFVNRLVALRDGKGIDVAIGVITDWQESDNIVIVRSPQFDIQQIRCLVIGDVTIEIADG
ncbi:MAG: Clp1/GlmU family protein [Planctomycetota bacterium]|jgi:polynucleotide 5'-hydroxyl-kinase GRC3/NOL9